MQSEPGISRFAALKEKWKQDASKHGSPLPGARGRRPSSAPILTPVDAEVATEKLQCLELLDDESESEAAPVESQSESDSIVETSGHSIAFLKKRFLSAGTATQPLDQSAKKREAPRTKIQLPQSREEEKIANKTVEKEPHTEKHSCIEPPAAGTDEPTETGDVRNVSPKLKQKDRLSPRSRKGARSRSISPSGMRGRERRTPRRKELERTRSQSVSPLPERLKLQLDESAHEDSSERGSVPLPLVEKEHQDTFTLSPPRVKQKNADAAAANRRPRSALVRTRSKRTKQNKQTVIYRRQVHIIPDLPVYTHTDSEEDVILQALYNRNTLFSSLKVGTMQQLVAAFESCTFQAGDEICRQGEIPEYFYIMDSGIVEFEIDGHHAGTAATTDSFGELGLLASASAAATVLALEDCKLYRVDSLTFRCILSTETQRATHGKLKLLEACHLSDVDPTVLQPRVVQPHEKIDVPKDAFYICFEGKLLNKDKKATIGPGDCFGDSPVVATSVSTIFLVPNTGDKITLRSCLDRQILAGMSVIRQQNWDESQLAHLVKEKQFVKGETIFSAGNATKAALYLIRDGVVTINDERNTSSHFGEAMVLRASSKCKKSIKAPYGATCKTNCQIGMLTLKDILSVMGPIPCDDPLPSDSSHAVGGSALETIQLPDLPVKHLKKPLPPPPEPVAAKLDKLKKQTILGEGTFGIVWLVLNEARPYALKIQSKAFLVGENQVDSVVQEKLMLDNVKHPFLINLFATYQDDKFVYMLLDFVQGGELFSLMHPTDQDCAPAGLPEEQAKFYALCVADVLTHLHHAKYVYRDLKPENIMIDVHGYVKLIDFGFCKYMLAEKTYTLVGTPGYLAPEIVSSVGHNFGADTWSLGILIYEMITGSSPFYYEDIDQMDLFESIANDPFSPPSGASTNACDILEKLLKKDPSERLGSGDSGEILEHAWFADLDLHSMRLRELDAPWVPDVKGCLDTNHFDDWSDLEDSTHTDISKKGMILSRKDAKLFEGVF